MPLLLLIPPALFSISSLLLKAGGMHLIPLLAELALITAWLEFRFPGFPRKFPLAAWGRFFRRILYTGLFLFFLGFILLIPDTSYRAWMSLLQVGRQGGTVSFAFIIPLTIFSSLGISRFILSRDRKTELFLLFLLIDLILIILLPKTPVIILSLLLLLIFLVEIRPVRNSRKSFPFVLLLFLLPLATALLVPLPEGDPRGSRAVDRLSRGLHTNLLSIFPDLPLSLRMPGYGEGYDTNRLTGAKPLLSDRTIFHVSGPPGTLLYLRTGTSSVFTGKSWKNDQPRPPLAPETPLQNPSSRGEAITLTLVADFFTRLPVTPQTGMLELRSRSFTVPPGGQAVLPPDSLPLYRGESLTLGPYSQTSSSETGGTVDDASPTGLRITRTPDPAVVRLAAELGEGRGDALLNRIETYLKKDYSYTLETRGSEDLLTDFLFSSRRGYCLHFATAAAVLAALNDRPVRLARGFLIILPSGGVETIPGQTEVTGLSAHVWPEILTEEGRWVPWEVTPPMAELTERNRSEGGTNNNNAEIRTEPEESGGQDPREEKGSAFRWSPLKRLLSVLVSAVLTALLIFLLILRKRQPARILSSLTAKARRRQGVRPPEETGWQAWGREVADLRPDEYEEIDQAVSIILRFLYRPLPPETSEKGAERKTLRDRCRFLKSLL